MGKGIGATHPCYVNVNRLMSMRVGDAHRYWAVSITRFSVWFRLKILFGCNIRHEITIYTPHKIEEAEVLAKVTVVKY